MVAGTSPIAAKHVLVVDDDPSMRDVIGTYLSSNHLQVSTAADGKTMARIPVIAGAHHEKLNGSGYPNRSLAESIPVQARIMTIADIYDALTARDRPYKKAMPVDRALDILGYEVRDGNIDAELVRLFSEARVFEAAAEKLEY